MVEDPSLAVPGIARRRRDPQGRPARRRSGTLLVLEHRRGLAGATDGRVQSLRGGQRHSRSHRRTGHAAACAWDAAGSTNVVPTGGDLDVLRAHGQSGVHGRGLRDRAGAWPPCNSPAACWRGECWFRCSCTSWVPSFRHSFPPAAGEAGWAAQAAAVWRYIVRPIAVGGMLVGAAYTLFRMGKNLTSSLGRALERSSPRRAAAWNPWRAPNATWDRRPCCR